MTVSRRDFLYTAALATAAWPVTANAQRGDATPRLFAHGVASGDPLIDRVILWTRVSPPPTRSAAGPIDVRWTIAADERLTNVIRSGAASAPPERDFTVKVDAGDLQPGRTYYYAFEAGGERSPVGRTRTLPQAAVQRIRLAVVSCANYPAGYFNAYRCLANRSEIDAVLHVGDYLYEFANGRYGDGSASGRVPDRPGEAVTLEDYRSRYATYRTDADLQEAHRLHPFIVVWDDHELANDAWSGGAANHSAAQGDWSVRMAAAQRAYLEWLPVRETPGTAFHLYRRFPFGSLADLVMLDARAMRDRQLPMNDAAFAAPARTMLGAPQEAWLFEQLRASQRADTRWRLLGQQVLFSPLTPPGAELQSADFWDGYPAARGRIFDFLAAERIRDLAIFTGDLHSSWAVDVARNPWTGYKPDSGAGSVAVELLAPAISSPTLFADSNLKQRASLMRALSPHLKYLEGEHNGYLLVDVTRNRLLAEWYFVPNVTDRVATESRAVAFACERGSSRLAPA